MPCNNAQPIVEDTNSIISCASTVLIFIDPETSIVQDQVIGDRAKILLRYDDGRENLITFNIPNEQCTVRDLVDEV